MRFRQDVLVLELGHNQLGDLTQPRKNYFNYSFEITDKALDYLGREGVIEMATVSLYNMLDKDFLKDEDEKPFDQQHGSY